LIAGELKADWVKLGVPAVASRGVLLEDDGDFITDSHAAHLAGVALRQLHAHPATVSRIDPAGMYLRPAARTPT
jgi:hypothetical protein